MKTKGRTVKMDNRPGTACTLFWQAALLEKLTDYCRQKIQWRKIFNIPTARLHACKDLHNINRNYNEC